MNSLKLEEDISVHCTKIKNMEVSHQRWSEEKWPLTVLEMFKQRVSDHKLGDIIGETQALNEMLNKMLLETS